MESMSYWLPPCGRVRLESASGSRMAKMGRRVQAVPVMWEWPEAGMMAGPSARYRLLHGDHVVGHGLKESC